AVARPRAPARSRGSRARAALARCAGDDARSLRLLARRRVAVERAARDRTVDRPHELAVLRGDLLRVAVLDGALEALRERLDRRAVAKVFEPLARCRADALLLLLDVRHSAAEGSRGAFADSTKLPWMTEVDQPLDHAEERAHRRRLARSTAVFGAATALSRVLGLIREMIAAPTFGAAGKINAFTVAFQIPNLVRALVADTALSGAFVPVFSELLERGERLRAWRVASTIFWLMLLLTTGLTAVFVLIAPLIVELFGTP